MPKQSYVKVISETKANYHAYLKSSEWEEFKQRKAEIEPKVCRQCGGTAIVQLHHMIYRDTPQESKLEDTIWLCQVHHKAYHYCGGQSMKRKTPPSVLVEKTLKVLRQWDSRQAYKAANRGNLDQPAWSYSPGTIKVVIAGPKPESQPQPTKESSSIEKVKRQIIEAEKGVARLKEKLARLQTLPPQKPSLDNFLKEVPRGSVLR